MTTKIKRLLRYFSKGEWMLWGASVALIVTSFLFFDRENGLILTASLIGATSLIFNAKGNPFGQALMVVFSVLYGVVSLSYAYYGEMITYLGMTAPMAVVALIAWLRNPYGATRAQVKVNRISAKEACWMIVLTAGVTAVFYVLLKMFHTANLILSTVSVTTSFLAVYLTFRRSACYALAYAANDVVLIALWSLAAQTDRAYLSVVICFVMFLANDIYGFISWKKMHAAQNEAQDECGE
ncbi:MAG: nicotinamide riboside transporter PnuC [Eubacteriales bacterium]|nr:nicotinamide riboside transporter PnuC [Eubacteriales bacterium]